MHAFDLTDEETEAGNSDHMNQHLFGKCSRELLSEECYSKPELSMCYTSSFKIREYKLISIL